MNRILDASALIRTVLLVIGAIWLGHLLLLG